MHAADHALVLDAVPLSPALADRPAHGRELVAALDLAAQFPARHERTLRCPVFPRS